MIVSVIDAYKGDYSPLDGNIKEEILLLENGKCVLLSPDQPDRIFDNFRDAFNHSFSCEMHFSLELLEVWKRTGYEIKEKDMK